MNIVQILLDLYMWGTIVGVLLYMWWGNRNDVR